jgi:hypothetical protein
MELTTLGCHAASASENGLAFALLSTFYPSPALFFAVAKNRDNKTALELFRRFCAGIKEFGHGLSISTCNVPTSNDCAGFGTSENVAATRGRAIKKQSENPTATAHDE